LPSFRESVARRLAKQHEFDKARFLSDKPCAISKGRFVELKSPAVIDLSGKLAIVTGAGRGIGAAIAETLGRAGADLVLADIDEDSARKKAERARQIGRKALAVETNVASPADVDRLFATSTINSPALTSWSTTPAYGSDGHFSRSPMTNGTTCLRLI